MYYVKDALKYVNSNLDMDPTIVPAWFNIYMEKPKKFGMLFEPFIFADNFGFTVYNGTISAEEVYEIYNRCKNELNIDFNFHESDLVYETNDYGEGAHLFFRGYAIDIASKLHKDNMKKIRKKSQSKPKRK